MTDTQPKEPRTAKPGTLLSQWWTLGAVLADRRTTGRHGAVAWVIIDRYMQKHGSGRASLRYIEKAAGVSRHTVIKACRELVEWGYFDQHLGIGTRPTEYSPKWLAVHPSAPLASGEPLCTTGGEPLCTTSDLSGAPVCTESYLPEPTDKSGLKVGRNDNTPDPLLAPGLTAGAAGSRDPFERFWSAYPRKYQKPKARAAWEKLAPDADLAERIIAAASEWAAHYEAHPVEKKWIPAPANWLAGERYDEDLPEVYVDAKQAAIAKPKKRPAKQAADIGEAKAQPANDEATFEPRRETLTIVSTNVHTEGGDTTLFVNLVDEAGKSRDIVIEIECADPHEQDRGQKAYHKLLEAVGLHDIEDRSELHGKRFSRVQRSKWGDWEYEPAEDEAVSSGNMYSEDEPSSTCTRMVVNDDHPIEPVMPRPRMPTFAEVVERHPMPTTPWPRRDYDDDEEERAARASMYWGDDDDDEEAA